MTNSRRLALVLAVACLLEALTLAAFARSIPAAPQVAPDAPDVAAAISAIERDHIQALPPFARTFAWGAFREFERDRKDVVAPGEIAARVFTPAERLARLNRTVASFGEDYRATARLLCSALLAAAIAALWTFVGGPSRVVALVPLGACLAVTPLVTVPAAGADFDVKLLPFVLPLLALGVPFLISTWREARARAGTRLDVGPGWVRRALSGMGRGLAWTTSSSRTLARLLLVLCVLEAVTLAAFAVSIPRAPRLAPDAADVAAVVSAIDRDHVQAMPPFARTFAWAAFFSYRDPRRFVVEPKGYYLDMPHAERVERFNRTVAEFGSFYRRTASLLCATLLVGAAAGLWTILRGPALLAGFVPLGACLSVTNIVAGPVVGVEFGARLLPFVLPLVVLGVPFLIATWREDRAGLARVAGALHARPGWTGLAIGAAVVAAGAGLIALGVNERVKPLVAAGAVVLGNGLVLVGGAVVFGIRRLLGRRGE